VLKCGVLVHHGYRKSLYGENPNFGLSDIYKIREGWAKWVNYTSST